MKNTPYICITGPDGAGKTTLIAEVMRSLTQQRGEEAAEITIWDLMSLPEEQRYISIASPQKVDCYLGSLHPVSRTLFLFHCFFQARAMAGQKEAGVYLLNGYWYKYAALEAAHGGDYESILRLAEIFPEPDLTFYLDIDPRTAAQRKRRFSGYETGFPADAERTEPQQDFIAFQEKARDLLQTIMQDRHHIKLDGKDSTADNTANIVKEICKRFAQ